MQKDDDPNAGKDTKSELQSKFNNTDETTKEKCKNKKKRNQDKTQGYKGRAS